MCLFLLLYLQCVTLPGEERVILSSCSKKLHGVLLRPLSGYSVVPVEENRLRGAFDRQPQTHLVGGETESHEHLLVAVCFVDAGDLRH